VVPGNTSGAAAGRAVFYLNLGHSVSFAIGSEKENGWEFSQPFSTGGPCCDGSIPNAAIQPALSPLKLED